MTIDSITTNNTSIKIQIMMELNKELAEFELLLKMLMQSIGLDIYRKNGSEFKNMGHGREDSNKGLLYLLYKEIDTGNHSNIKHFLETKEEDIKGFLLLRNSFIHGNLKQSFEEFYKGDKRKTIDSNPQYAIKISKNQIKESSVEDKEIKSLIITYISEDNLKSTDEELKQLNTELYEILAPYLSKSEHYNFPFF